MWEPGGHRLTLFGTVSPATDTCPIHPRTGVNNGGLQAAQALSTPRETSPWSGVSHSSPIAWEAGESLLQRHPDTLELTSFWGAGWLAPSQGSHI